MTDILRRDLAPIADGAWQEIERQSARILKGGALLSRRGGDFGLTVGEDLAIRYKSHNTKEVDLYFTESFTFRVLEPAAAVALELKAQTTPITHPASPGETPGTLREGRHPGPQAVNLLNSKIH